MKSPFIGSISPLGFSSATITDWVIAVVLLKYAWYVGVAPDNWPAYLK